MLVLPLLLASGLLGCAMGPDEETLVDELRVMATVTDPPEVAPGETVAIETWVADPDEAGFDVLSWPCTFTGEGCLEAEELTGEAWAGAVHTPDQLGTTVLSDSYLLSPALADFLSEEPVPLVQLWTLACEPGLCPAMELAAAEPAAGTEEAAALQAVLSAPTEQMKDLPLVGASLGVRWVTASTRSAEERSSNPSIACEVLSQDSAEQPEVLAGDSLLYTCFVEGDFDGYAGAWGYATGGGWEGATYLLDPGVTLIEYEWFAPEELPASGLVDLWVIITDGQGGVGLWQGQVAVSSG